MKPYGTYWKKRRILHQTYGKISNNKQSKKYQNGKGKSESIQVELKIKRVNINILIKMFKMWNKHGSKYNQ